MKSWLLFALILTSFALHAEVKISSNPLFTKKENKIVKPALTRAVKFYSWYLNYLQKNHSRPLQNLVIDQYTTAHMRDLALTNTSNYDIFLASTDLYNDCDFEIMPEKIESKRIFLKGIVTGKYNYVFHIDMIIQKGNWCIDLVTSEEDMNPQLSEVD